MAFKDVIKELFTEVYAHNYKSISGSYGNRENNPGGERLRDKFRKRKDRAKMKSSTSTKSKTTVVDEEVLDPRMNLEGDLRFTPKEMFGYNIIKYLDEGKSKYIVDAVDLLENYPKLKAYVQQLNTKLLPQQPFTVYYARPRLNENVGDVGKRSKGSPHNWYLSKAFLKDNINLSEDAYIMEIKINPSDVMLYYPAYTKLMENVIFSGKIPTETLSNVIRKAKKSQEVVLTDKFNEGLIVEIIE